MRQQAMEARQPGALLAPVWVRVGRRMEEVVEVPANLPQQPSAEVDEGGAES